MSKEAMKLALEAADELEWMLKSGYEQSREGPPRVHRLIGKIKALAEQPAHQEPYGYVSTHTNGQMHFNKTFQGVYTDTATGIVAVYTAPQTAQQEPVACGYDETTGNCTNKPCCYAPPPAQRTWVGLTDEEIESLDCVYLNWMDYEQVEIKGDKEFARAVEAKLKEKNNG